MRNGETALEMERGGTVGGVIMVTDPERDDPEIEK